MFAKQIEPPENNQIQYPFTCSRCRKPSQTAFMCEKCFEETDPTQKQGDSAWFEPPKSKSRKGRGKGRIQWLAEQKAKKDAKTFTDLAAEYFAKQAETLAPGWTERIQEFAQHENQINERQAWLRNNATQLWAVQSWLYWLEEMDRIRISEKRWKEAAASALDVANIDISDVREDRINHDSVNIIEWENFENELPEDFTPMSQSKLKSYSRYTVFAKKVVELLSNEEFAILQILVHQIKTNRLAHSIRTYTSNDAAKALTIHLGHTVTATNYRKLVEKLYATLEVEDGLHLNVWIESGYL